MEIVHSSKSGCRVPGLSIIDQYDYAMIYGTRTPHC
jgi:hypothetical protein